MRFNKSFQYIQILLIFALLPFSGNAQSTDSTSQKNYDWGIFPAFGSQPETGFQFGVTSVLTWWKPENLGKEYFRPSSFTPFIMYTLRNQIISEFNVDYWSGNGKNLNASPRFIIFPDRFFGIGNDNDPDQFESYTHQFVQLEGQLSIPITQKLFWGSYFDMQQSGLRKFEENGLLEDLSINGSQGGFLVGIGPAMRFDSRNNAIYPSTGYFINVRSLFATGNFEYQAYSFDLRRYFSLNEDIDVLAVQVNSTFTGGNDIPFYKLPKLGGGSFLRGISNASVYTDRQMMYSQIEYRRIIYGIFGAVAFVGIGDVANEINDFQLSEFKYAGGLGLRFQLIKEQRLNVRLDYGLARGGQSAFYVSLREAF